jgi:hypothetical protein
MRAAQLISLAIIVVFSATFYYIRNREKNRNKV